MPVIALDKGAYEYDISSLLGPPGGFGAVYRGTALSTNNHVAIKHLRLDAHDAARREVRIANTLLDQVHENVIPFLDAGEDANGSGYFVVMPIAEGSLQQYLNENGAISPTETREIILAIASGLLEVPGLIHRDLKPGNILKHEGIWKIADFGIGKFVEDSTSSATLQRCLTRLYAAPEQHLLEPTSEHTDIYSLACIAWYLLVGAPLFVDDPEKGHTTKSPPSVATVSPRLNSLLQMALRKAPQGRPSKQRFFEILRSMKNPEPIDQAQYAPNKLAIAAAKHADAEAKLEEERRERDRALRARDNLASDAWLELESNLDRLCEKITADAPNASVSDDRHITAITLAKGTLLLHRRPEKMQVMNPALFVYSKWDVVTWSGYSISQPHRRIANKQVQVFSGPPPQWDATLVFCRLPDESDYRWYEIGVEGPRRENLPHRVAQVEQLDELIRRHAPILFGPWPIDLDAESDFHARIHQLFGHAVEGTLGHLNRRPLKLSDWPPTLVSPRGPFAS
jgi:serine/threonine protein kinase